VDFDFEHMKIVKPFIIKEFVLFLMFFGKEYFIGNLWDVELLELTLSSSSFPRLLAEDDGEDV
jgi:hypothetical protein